jgi:hypothetical protein
LIIYFLFPIAECDEEKIKRAIYNYYQKGPKEPNGGKSNDDYFKNFQGISPFEQVLAALGLSGDDHSKIHTSVEYWPPDMDRDKFYQMVKGEAFPFTSWKNNPTSHSASAPIKPLNHSPIKPIFEEVQDEVPVKFSTPIKKPEKAHKSSEMKTLSPNYYPVFIDHVVTYPPIEEQTEVQETFKYIKGKNSKHVPQVFEEVSEYPEYPTYTKEISKPSIKYEKLPEVVKEKPKVGTLKIKEVFKSHREEAPKFHYITQAPKSPVRHSKIYEEIPKKAPRIVEVTPKIIMEAYTTTTTHKPKLYKSKFYSSKLPAQPELPSSQSTSSPFNYKHVTSSAIESSSGDDDISMTDAGPVLFPEVTTLKSKVQRGSVGHATPQQENHHEQHLHEVRQQPTRSNKKRKLKKKVKTSSIAQEVVDIGNRGTSGTLHTPLQPLDVIVVTTTIAPKTSYTASTSVNFIANDAVTDDNKLVGGSSKSHLSDGYVDPHYSDMIDNLSKLTELSFNTKSYKTEIGNDFVPKVYSTASTTEFSPVTETLNNNNFEFRDGNSSIVTDENMIAVLNLMKNASTVSESSMEELKKAVIDNDLPKVKKIVRQHVGKRPVSTTESSSVTRGKLSRSRFGLKTKVTSSTTESSTTALKISSSSTLRSKILKRPVTTVKQVISTTARSGRQSNRTRPSTTSRSTTNRSTKSIVRRVTTTRKSIKTTSSA